MLYFILHSGACGVLVAHPLDTIKVWQQASNSSVVTAIQQIYSRNNGVSLKKGLRQVGVLQNIDFLSYI